MATNKTVPTITEARNKALSILKKLSITAFNGWAVQVIHRDRSVTFFHEAIARQWKDYYFVFTEHHGFFVYHKDELIHCRQYIAVAVVKVVK